MSKQRLKQPLCGCRLGFIYNKDVIVQQLFEKKIPKEFEHIKKYKDIKTLNIPETQNSTSEFIVQCPLTGIEYNGFNKFYFLWSCGCIFSDKVLNEVKNNEKKCVVCGLQYNDSDLISLNLTPEEQRKIKYQLISKQDKKKKDEEEKLIRKRPATQKLNDNFIDKHQQQIDASLQPTNILDQISEIPDSDKLKDTQTYKSLFHKEYKVTGDLVYRNVKHGIR